MAIAILSRPGEALGGDERQRRMSLSGVGHAHPRLPRFAFRQTGLPDLMRQLTSQRMVVVRRATPRATQAATPHAMSSG